MKTQRSSENDGFIDVKNVFHVFYFDQVLFTFLTFFYFSSVFYFFLKTLAKLRAASRLTRSAFKIAATK